MSDESTAKAAAAASEPSMEDILASIRRILAEDGEPDAAKDLPPAEPPPVDLLATAESIAVGPDERPDPPIRSEFEGEPFSAEEEPLREDMFLLTPNMRVDPTSDPAPAPPFVGARVVSSPTVEASTDVLAHLAKAILDRRDIAVGARDVTIEGMIREMLRPLLREWLDRNLPYLIERLVKKEIDLMVNRAERLND